MNSKIKPNTAAWLLAIVYFVGVLGFSYGPSKKIMVNLIWVNLVFTLVVLLVFHKKWTFEFVLAMVLVGISGFLLEVVGVNTRLVFGNYFYGPTLGYKIWHTPIMMCVNWLLTVYITRQVAELMAKDAVVVAAIASVLMLVLDYFIEPFAMKYGMWSWYNNVVPMHNYIGWLISGFVIQYAFVKSVKMPANKLSLPVFVIQLAFFVVLFLLKNSF